MFCPDYLNVTVNRWQGPIYQLRMWSLTGDGAGYYNTEQRQKRWQVSFLSNVLDLSCKILILQRRKRTILVLQGTSISFPTWRIGAVLYSSDGMKMGSI